MVQSPRTRDRLLEIDDLAVEFLTPSGRVRAVDGVSFGVEAGETVAVVGESGCGKSVSALSILGLVPAPPGRISRGAIHFEGRDLIALDEEALRRVRGHEIAMIFQEPMTSLNPLLSIRTQLCEAMETHLALTPRQARARAIDLLKMVGIPEPERRLAQYPHHFSGGMRQRVMIAIALSCEPKLIIADEPTTALDVTIQAQILKLMKDLTRRIGAAVILITHNLGVVARYADRVNVMYAGRIVEAAMTREIFARPCHPYTIGLLGSVPRMDRPAGAALVSIEGQPPDLARLDQGCAYRPRCRWAVAACATGRPPLEPVPAPGAPAADHASACFRVSAL